MKFTGKWLILFLIIIIAASNMMAMAQPLPARSNSNAIKILLARHHKQEYAQVRLRSGKRIEGTLAQWDARALTIQSQPDNELRTIALAQIDSIRFVPRG